MQHERVTVVLAFWGAVTSFGVKAYAVAEARLSPTQVIVDGGADIVWTRDPALRWWRSTSRRYRRDTRSPIGSYNGRWRLVRVLDGPDDLPRDPMRT